MLHIVRVIERQEPGRTPFLEAQVGIRDTLRDELNDGDSDTEGADA